MSPQLMEIERRAFRLPAREREVLAERLMQSVDDVPLTEVDEAWIIEAERRLSAHLRGERKGVPASRALRLLEKGLRR